MTSNNLYENSSKLHKVCAWLHAPPPSPLWLISWYSPFPLWGSISELSEILPPEQQLVGKMKDVMVSCENSYSQGWAIEPQGNSGKHIKGGIPVSPHHPIEVVFCKFSVNLVICKSFFLLPPHSCKNLYILAFPPISSEWFLRATRDAVSWA